MDRLCIYLLLQSYGDRGIIAFSISLLLQGLMGCCRYCFDRMAQTLRTCFLEKPIITSTWSIFPIIKSSPHLFNGINNSVWPAGWLFDGVLLWLRVCWYIANIVNISVFNTLSIDSGIVVVVLLIVKREAVLSSQAFFACTRTQCIFVSHAHLRNITTREIFFAAGSQITEPCQQEW